MDQLPFHLSQLPEAIQQQVLDFVEFLLAKYRQKQVQQPVAEKYPLRGSVTYYDRPFDP